MSCHYMQENTFLLTFCFRLLTLVAVDERTCQVAAVVRQWHDEQNQLLMPRMSIPPPDHPYVHHLLPITSLVTLTAQSTEVFQHHLTAAHKEGQLHSTGRKVTKTILYFHFACEICPPKK